MRSTIKKSFVLIIFMIMLSSFKGYIAQTKNNSIIKLFCINNFKEEMLKADLKFSEEIAKETCECYLEEFVKTSSHQNAITKCKLEAQEKLNL